MANSQQADDLLKLAERLASVATGMRSYGLRKIAWNKSMDLRPQDLSEASERLRALAAQGGQNP